MGVVIGTLFLAVYAPMLSIMNGLDNMGGMSYEY
jgi:type II secretory pathway component PulF